MKNAIKKFVRFVFSKNMFLLICLLVQIAIFVSINILAGNVISRILGQTFTLVAFIVALIINNTNQHSDIKLAYVIILVLFPVYGTLTYCLSLLGMGKRKFKKHLYRLEKQATHLNQNNGVIENMENNYVKGIANYLYNIGSFPTYQNTKSTYFSCGEALYDDLLNELKNAKKFIFLEYYIIQYGVMLNSILDVLKEKVNQGVEVRILYDGTNSIARIPHNFVKKMNKCGIKCKMFMPVRAIMSTEQNNRDHRKICVIDNKISYTGGLNLADEYINIKQPYGHWKDVGVKLEGEATTSFTQMFLKMWNFKLKTIEDFDKYLIEKYSVESNEYIIPFSDHPHDNEDTSKTTILQILANSKNYVYITTPYLVLDDELRNALCNTAKRGVNVNIITPDKPDKKIIYCVTQSNYKTLIKAGVKIYQYTPGFIHAKMLVADDEISMLGTVNMDYRSLLLNFEDSVLIYKSNQIEKIKSDFEDTRNKSRLITLQEYKKFKMSRKFFGRLLKIIAPLL